MSVTFCGRAADGTPIALDIEDPAHLNMSSANARTFVFFLGVEPGDDLHGEVTTPEARRAVMRARATFERRVGGFICKASDTKRPGKVRVIEAGIDVEYIAMRLDDFERFLGAVAERGATIIYWG